MKNISISFVFLLYILSPITAQYDDPKWEFGAEVGFAWIGFPRQVIALDIFDTQSQETNRTNRVGFRVFATAKYNLIDQIQILGSIGLVNAKGTVRKNNSTRSLFGSSTTYSSEEIMQKFTLVELPIYFRFHLLNERRSTSSGMNLFIDLGKSFKIPITSELYFKENDTDEISLQILNPHGIYLGLGFLMKKTTIAFTWSGIRTKAEQNEKIKFNSRICSLSTTIYF